LVGDTASPGGTDTIFVHRIKEPEVRLAEVVETDPVLASVVDIATELGGSYRGEPVGTAFMIGNIKAVMRRSRELIPNPLKGHGKIFVTNPKDREIIKRYAYLDGAFIVDNDGCVLAAGRYLDANARVNNLPKGFGTRHRAVAAMTAATGARGVTVSGSDGMIRIFKKGKLVVRIDPKSKMLMEALKE
jgi:DNA integrity scanning protein DisA with diadenylate cyclase activity